MLSIVLKSTFRSPTAWTGRSAVVPRCLSTISSSRLYHRTAIFANKSKVDEISGSNQDSGKSLTPEEEQEIVGRLRRQLDDQAVKLGTVPVFKRALQYGNSVAIKDQNGEFSYARLYMGAKRLAADITSICGRLNCVGLVVVEVVRNRK